MSESGERLSRAKAGEPGTPGEAEARRGSPGSLTRAKLLELLAEGCELRKLFAKRVEPMRRITAEDLARRCR